MDQFDGVQTRCKLVFETNNQENFADFKITQFFINNTEEDIFVLHRNNFPVYCKRSTGHFAGAGCFTIRTLYKFSSNQRIVDTLNMIHNIKSKFHLKQEDLDLITESLIAAYDADRNVAIYTVAIDREVSVREIRLNSVMYITDVDLLLCDTRSFGKYPHPYSPEGQVRADYKRIAHEKKISGVFIELVDNEQTVKNRFMYVAKKLVQIPSHTDMTKESGVYFTRSEHDSLGDTHLHPEYLSFEDAEKELGLYKTKDEALTGGNPEYISKEALKAKEIELENLRMENARQKEIIDKNKMQRTDKFEEVSLSRKQYYEDRSLDRKDQSEFLKMAGVVVATGIGIYVALSKTNARK